MCPGQRRAARASSEQEDDGSARFEVVGALVFEVGLVLLPDVEVEVLGVAAAAAAAVVHGPAGSPDAGADGLRDIRTAADHAHAGPACQGGASCRREPG